MSTTSDKNVAIRYCCVGGNTTKVPFVFEIHAGAVDRGACIRDFSQYAAEVEYLFVPCSFLEQDGPTRLEVTAEGVVKIIPAKVNANLKTPTVEELVGQKRALHVSAFAHLVHDVERELHDAAAALDVPGRLADDPTRIDGDSVQGFIARIVQQCKDVLARHQAVPPEDYADDRRFRGLVLEMFDVKVMAQSKLDEWLENKSSSFIRFRWNASLTTVHRRWMAYLSRRLADCPNGDRQAAALRLCKLCGLVVTSVDVRNELGETRLMAAAADGRAKIFLKMLVDAGADVNQGRPDGVTAVWLAAQFGHVACVSALAELGADLNKAANDGATPVYIAAQAGNLECIQLLAKLKADMNSADKKGLTPAHQAAMNGHVECIELLETLGADVNRKADSGSSPLDLAKENQINWPGMKKTLEAKKSFLSRLWSFSVGSSSKSLAVEHAPKLIISTGDISDIDGFIAMAEYAKAGADVLFIMNYPAYINVKLGEEDGSYAEKNPGLGYKYSAKQVFDAAPRESREEYDDFLRRYERLSEGEQMKGAMTDVAFYMLSRIWDDRVNNSGRLLFCIGGVNSVNPFSATAIKNEVYVYSKLIPKNCKKLPTVEGTVVDAAGQQCLLELSKYREIYMDFNGSMAFWNERWLNDMSQDDVVSNLKGLFIMGGVYANKQPVTAPSIKGVLNRFSSATMNQLYHPQHAADFFAFAARHKVPAYIVTNNVVEDLGTDAAVERFLHANGLSGKMLGNFANAHYNSRYKPARKPFDYYAALALTTLASDDGDGSAVLHARPRRLFYNNLYGITYVAGVADTWESTRTAYIRNIDMTERPDDDDRTRTKKENFRKEIAMLKSISHLDSKPVFDLRFHLDSETGKLALCQVESDDDNVSRTASASEPAPPQPATAEVPASAGHEDVEATMARFDAAI